MEYRLYSFVAGLYLSELQKGLQTAHVISELSVGHVMSFDEPGQYEQSDAGHEVYTKWATKDKTIVICSVGNSGGVLEQYLKLAHALKQTKYYLPLAIFNEDEASLGGAATACGLVVPDTIYTACAGFTSVRGLNPDFYELQSGARFYSADPWYNLIHLIKSKPLA